MTVCSELFGPLAAGEGAEARPDARVGYWFVASAPEGERKEAYLRELYLTAVGMMGLGEPGAKALLEEVVRRAGEGESLRLRAEARLREL
jgi:hypothetical protein